MRRSGERRSARTHITVAMRQAFLARVEKTTEEACWIWRGVFFRKKCVLCVGKTNFAARRVAWAIAHFDEMPPANQNVYTHCREQRCVNPAHMYTQGPMERFMLDVRKTETCWWWTGLLGKGGYGKFCLHTGNNVRSHRWLYEQLVGPVAGDKFVCHRCDNKLCVRPSHMFVGTPEENMHDAIAKGRNSRGPKHSAIMKATRERKAS